MNGTDTWLEPLDEVDASIMRELREVASRLDPYPADLTERITFALTVQALQAEVAELITQPELVSRSGPEDPTEASTVTFSTDNLSIMITIAQRGSGHALARLDGWLTCGTADVELDPADGEKVTVTSDRAGRFVLVDVPHGAARLIVSPREGRPVITPQFTI